jgi:hypothetical protein
VSSSRPYPRYPSGRWVIALLPLLALPALLAACGGSTKAATAGTTTTTTPAGGSTAAASYRQCLTSHGVPASAVVGLGGGRRRTGTTTPGSPSPTAPTGTRPTIPAQYQGAFTACQSLRPAGGFGGGGGNLNGTQFAAYRNCLQLHGVTVPTTTPGQTASTGGFGGGQLRNDPAFPAAQKACASLLPARSATGTTLAPAA